MYKVGQTIYTIIEDKYKVIPLKISEQIVTKTLEGETVSFKALMPNKKMSKIDLTKLKNIYTNISEVKKYMLENAENAIDNVLKETSNVEGKFFKKEKAKEENDNLIEELSACNSDTSNDIINSNDPPPSSINIDLGDGQIGKLNIKSIDEVLDQKKNEHITP